MTNADKKKIVAEGKGMNKRIWNREIQYQISALIEIQSKRMILSPSTMMPDAQNDTAIRLPRPPLFSESDKV